MVDFAKRHGMVIASTYFERKEMYKGTWKTSDNRTCNQIDHVLVEKGRHGPFFGRGNITPDNTNGMEF